jgi:hypothetical protein
MTITTARLGMQLDPGMNDKNTALDMAAQAKKDWDDNLWKYLENPI